ncbi:MAG: peptidoglycan D,D-transpeptidase FtsI family protein [Armatimonadota bacterium]
MQHRIRRLFGFFLFAFVVLIGWQSYWHLFASDALLAMPGNRRLARAERTIPRGAIYDSQGRKLAWSENGTRRYADPIVTAPVLGYMDPVYGRVGIEGLWNAELSGLSRHFGAEDLQRIATGEKPQGKDLVLTLDLKLQQAAQKALKGKRGAVVALDPATGAIRALASSPTFDPRTIGDDYDKIVRVKTGALRNRALQDHYPPGSTMKVVTATAALTNDIDEETTFTCTGRTRIANVSVTDYHGARHGSIAMDMALTKSCNNYFARLAVKVGPENFVRTAEAFGFNTRWWTRQTDSRMNEMGIAGSSLAPDPRASIPDGELAHMGFGQSTVVATPLQMAMVTAAIANDGGLRAPYLVAQVRKGGTRKVLKEYSSLTIGYPLNGYEADKLKQMMNHVVTRGTATRARVSGLTVYGKTGTAQQTGGEDHAWFIGFAERDQAKIAFAVLIERGGTGGQVAVPVAKQVLEAWKEESE